MNKLKSEEYAIRIYFFSIESKEILVIFTPIAQFYVF